MNLKESYLWKDNFESFKLIGSGRYKFLNGQLTSKISEQNFGKILCSIWLNSKGYMRGVFEIKFLKDEIILIALIGNILELRNYYTSLIVRIYT